jgi:RNA ligase
MSNKQIVKTRQEITKPDEIQTVEDISRLLLEGEDNWRQYGRVAAYPHPSNSDLQIFNYQKDAFRGDGWTQFEILARGLILNSFTGEVVARSFDKFFNYGEYGVTTSPVGKIKNVYEKVDGNLGVLYRLDGGYRISTRGRFDSGAAVWATKFLNDHFDLTGLEEELTLIFEIVNPDIRVIVNYEGLEDIILLAARNRFTGEYVEVDQLFEIAARYNFNLPAIYSLNTIEEIIEASQSLDENAEGYVVEYEDGSRWKVKGERYRHIARLVINLNFRNTVRAMRDNVMDTYLDLIPAEFMTYVNGWIAKIEAYKADTVNHLKDILASLPEETRNDKKKLAIWITENYGKKSSEANYLMYVHMGKDISRGLYQEMLELPNEFIDLTNE